MKIADWYERVRGPRGRRKTPPAAPQQVFRQPRLEGLEDRISPAGHTLATALRPDFTGAGAAHVADFIASVDQVDLYRVHLGLGERITASVGAPTGSEGASTLRVFDSGGAQRALNNEAVEHPLLSFLARAAGDYYVGVSAIGNDRYDPRVANSGGGRYSTGLYTLDLRLTTPAPRPDLTGTSFGISTGNTAAYGETVSGTFVVENHGGADSAGFTVQVVLSSGPRFDGFDPSQMLNATFASGPPMVLAAGQSYGGTFTTQLPTTAPVGFSVSGPVYVGLLITPDDPAQDSGTFDKSGVHRGADYETLTIVTPVPDGVTDLSQTDTGLNTRVSGTLQTPLSMDTYRFTVTAALGTGRLTAEVRPDGGGLVPRVSLFGQDGRLLIQSDDGSIVQQLNPGSYSLAVSAQSGTGAYQLTSQFVPTSSPLNPGGIRNEPPALVMADVNGDGRPDLISASPLDGTVRVQLGNGDGSFQTRRDFAIGVSYTPHAIAVVDVNGDGRPDLVVTNYGAATASVLLGNGDGSFQAPQRFLVGSAPHAVAVADVNGDGCPDLVVTNSFYDGHHGFLFHGTVSVLLGNGDGSFQAPRAFAVGLYPTAVAVADLNGDGRLDIVTANLGGGTVSVLLGNGDGSFQTGGEVLVGRSPRSVAVADVNGDGRPDIVTANIADGTASVLLGKGDGSFQTQRTFAVGAGPTAVAVADVNGDGRPDLIFADSNPALTGNRYVFHGTVSVLLGNGDGSFQAPRAFAVGVGPSTLAVVDVNGDGRPDLVYSSQKDGTVNVLLGNGDGSFQTREDFAVGSRPLAVAAADFNGDGRPDLVFANFGDDTISVLLGNGDGTFQPQRTFAVGSQPRQVVVADVNGDGRPDLIVTNSGRHGTVSVLLGNGDGSFQSQQSFAVGYYPSAVAVVDVNGDGRLDLVSPATRGGTAFVLLGNGDGSFQKGQVYPAGSFPSTGTASRVAVVDVNGDGRPDRVSANYGGGTADVLLGNGDGSFITPSSPIRGVGILNSPSLADLDDDHIKDSVILDRSGRILFRKGLPGAGNPFAPPVTINDTIIDERTNLPVLRAARELTVFHTAAGWAVATADAHADPTLPGPGHAVFTVSRYTVGADGKVTRSLAFSTDRLPTRIAAADLTGNGRDDIVAADSLDNTVQVAFQNADGTFGSPITLTTGQTPSDISLADVNGDGLPDIAITNQVSGDVSVFLNDPTHSFAQGFRYRAGTGLYGLSTDPIPVVGTLEQSVSLSSGDLTGNGRNDLVVVNRGAHSFSVLANNGHGGFANPRQALTTSTSSRTKIPNQPGPVVVGDFNHDGKQDVAILMADTSEVWVYLGKGDGTFDAPIIDPAGAGATGFTFLPRDDGHPDRFLVGNSYGDILTLDGDDTGHFVVARGDLTARPLAVGKSSDGRSFAVVADQQLDRVRVHFRDSAMTAGFDAPHVVDSSAAPLLPAAPPLAPGAIVLADLQGDGGKSPSSMIVANRLGNQILVYPGLPDGTFGAPAPYPVGFEPVAVTVADFNGDGVPDLAVVNHGSNDISILTGNIDPKTGRWFATAGPRLDSGGSGPIAVDVGDFNHDGIPDLRVTNGDGSVGTLAGIGSGGKGTAFFRPPTDILSLGSTITQVTFDPITNREFLVSGGAIRSFDGTTFTAVATAGNVTTLGVVDGLLVAGFADGSVGLMTEEGTVLRQSSSFGDQPSALQALQDGGSIDVYLTLNGSQVPVFVSLLIPVLTELPKTGAVAQATGVSGADLVLVATLLTGGLEEARPQEAEVATSEATFILFLPPVKVAVPQGAGQADEVEKVEVALVVRADPQGEGSTPEFQQRVRDALAERLSGQQVYDSVEDLVEAIRGALKRFEVPAPASESDGVSEVQFEEVALGRVAEAVVSVNRDEGGVGPSRADLPWLSDPVWEQDSLPGFQSAMFAAWLCRAPEPRATDGKRSPPSRRSGSRWKCHE